MIPLTNANAQTLQQLLNEFRQYSDFPFIGEAAVLRLRNLIVAWTNGAVNPPLDQLGNNHTRWMLEALNWFNSNTTQGTCPECPQCPQDMQIAWTPANLNLGELIGFMSFGDLPGITSISFNMPTNVGGFDVESMNQLVSLTFPNLVSIDPDDLQDNGFVFKNHPLLSIFEAPKLFSIGGPFVLQNNSALTALSLLALTEIRGQTAILNNANLTSVSLPLLSVVRTTSMNNNPLLSSIYLPSLVFPDNTSFDFSGNALDVTSVNALLASAVASIGYNDGLLDLSGGTNAAPAGQGIADKATLMGRPGVTVITN